MAGAGVTGVKEVSVELPVTLTMTRTATTTTTRPTAPQVRRAVRLARGAAAVAGRPAPRSWCVPALLPAVPPLPDGALAETGRLWARLLSLAL